MIRYPDDRVTEEEAIRHGIPDFVLIRDLVRIVEVLNLAKQGFFNTQSVLAGSMALRCFNTPRFTVYDADFATTVEAKRSRSQMRDLLRYVDDDLEISPAELTPHDAGGTAKHYADLAFIALAAQPEAGPLLRLDRAVLRETLAAKLAGMKAIQPDRYAGFASVDDVVRELRLDPEFSAVEWEKLVYLRSRRDRFSQVTLKRAVQALLVPLLGGQP